MAKDRDFTDAKTLTVEEVSKKEKCFKVVRVLDNGDRVSCLIPARAKLLKTYQKDGKNLLVDECLVFLRFEDTTKFLISSSIQIVQKDNYSRYFNYWTDVFEIWEGEAEILKDPPKYGISIYSALKRFSQKELLEKLQKIKELNTNGDKEDIYHSYIVNFPENTKTAINFKLVREIS